MTAPAQPSINPDLLVSINPGANTTRGFYARRRQPEVAGYKLRCRAEGAAKLVGFNHPGTAVGGFPIGSINTNVGGSVVAYTSPRNKVFRTIGKGDSTAQLANGFENYTLSTTGDFVTQDATVALPAGTIAQLLADSSGTTGYANAVLLAYPLANKDANRPVMLTRVGSDEVLTSSGSSTAKISGMWKVNTTTAGAASLDVCWDYNATPASTHGVPITWALELILPASADIVTLFEPAAASEAAITSTDFMFGGKTSGQNILTLTRLFG